MPPRRVLILADGSEPRSKLPRRVLELGFELSGVAATAEEALALVSEAQARESPPHLVLAQTSPEALQHFWSSSDLPVLVVLQEGAAGESTAEIERVGASGFILGPFTARELRLQIDLTLARVEAEEELRRLENRFFMNSIDLLCCLGFSGHFLKLNPAWERVLGYSMEELMARPFIEFVHPEDRERTLRQNATVRGGGQAIAFENRYRCRDGSYRWFRWNATPDTTARTIYSVARDVTEQREAEEERERLLAELRAALSEVESLQEILPICSYCRKIRDDQDYWHTVEAYFAQHSSTRFSHGICPSCLNSEVGPEFREEGA